MEIRIQIPINNQENEELSSYGKEPFSISESKDILVQIMPRPSRNAFPNQETVTLVIQFVSSVAAQVIATWLYDKFRKKTDTIILGKRTIDLKDIKELEKVIKNEIEKNNKKKSSNPRKPK